MDQNLTELLFRIFNDPMPSIRIEAAYLVAQTRDNQNAVLDAAEGVPADRLLILQTRPRSGYPGFDRWHSILLERGTAVGRIEAVPMNDGLLLNTRTEAQALMEHVRKHDIGSLLITAPPFHQVRAFMTAATIALEEQVEVRLYSRAGRPMDWNAETVHSQGTLQARRSDLIHAEMERINIYQAKGDLAPSEQILTYLQQRDG